MPEFVESHKARRLLLPTIAVGAVALIAIALFITRSDDDHSKAATPPTATPTSIDATAAYSAQLHDAYGSYYSKLNLYFSTCQLSITTIDFKACSRAIDAAIAAVTTFDTTASKLQPPAVLAGDQQQILSADPGILDVLRRSKAAADAGDGPGLRAINPTFQAAYTVSCDALVHYNSLTVGHDHLRTDLGPGCPD
jgi:hypothetical protein